MPHLMPALWPPFLVGLGASALLETLLRPRPAPFYKRPIATLGVHVGSWCVLFALFTLVFQRPWFAVVLVSSLTLVVVQSSNTKSRTLKEPFICHDFEYFWDAILHPRLYVPFFGIKLALAASVAGALAIGSFLYFEPALITHADMTHVAGPLSALLALGALLIVWGVTKSPTPSFDPARDMHRLGLFTSLWCYGVALFRSTPPVSSQSPFEAQANTPLGDQAGATLANVVLVQSESFFDPRPWCRDIPPGVLSRFDATWSQALQKGALRVPAWGANTVRTECAVLTGLPASAWGARRFNPYHTLARQGLPSIAAAFKARGYRTVCVHPYNARFYKRDRVFPNLGFDTFIDIEDFTAADRQGQYTSDLAVARKVGRLLEDDDNRPLFVFVITMENHGPLHLEAPDRASASATLPGADWPLAPYLRDLAVYLRHLSETDEMIERLKVALESAPRTGLLAFYGDHVPILPDAYAHFGDPGADTPYMIWSTEAHAPVDAVPAGFEAQALDTTTLEAHEIGIILFKRTFGHDISSERIEAAPEPQEQE